jgi:hypothetical protein
VNPEAIDKDRIDALIALAEFRRDRMKERSQYEWRMTIAFWAFLIATNRNYVLCPPATT